VIHIADISEFQPTVDFAQVGPAVIVRAHNGRRPDRVFTAHRDGARAHCQVRGFYGYVVKDRDAATQGREMAALVGRLQPGEFIACDLEEGDGDQTPRAEAWSAVVDEKCGGKAWVYSGASFRTDHLAGEARTFWEAAYQNLEPHDRHVLWQHSDHENHPGIGPCDCSIFDGSVEDLLTLINGGTVALTPADLAAIKGIVDASVADSAMHADIVTELRGTPDGKHPANLQSIYADVEAIKTKLGA
jgi:GH25 family lysozyme M1 (1,4-beta-N-acetylmuramidase)